MTDGGRQKPPSDDRTLLDPLNADELKALREARAKMQAAKGGAVAHQVVVGPDAGDDIGEAPTRAMPALPQFESNGASLEKLNTGGHRVGTVPKATVQPQVGATSAHPAGIGGAGAAAKPANVGRPNVPAPAAGPAGGKPGVPNGPGGGFGENTLLWMAPPKPAPTLGGAPNPLPPTENSKAKTQRLIKAGAVVGVVFAIVIALSLSLAKKERTTIDLHTNPPKAQVKINGSPTKNVTPMKLNLVEGTWEIEVNLEDHKPEVFTLTVDKGSQPMRKDIELQPISKAGLMTVGIGVQPVAANITVDGEIYPARKNVSIANLDPKRAHKIVIEAGGYVKQEHEISAGQLKERYNFVLQADESVRLE
jgi:hypothetical protein